MKVYRITLHHLFLIDFCGAMLSAIVHFCLLAPLDHLIGLDARTIYILGSLALLLAAFSGFQYFRRSKTLLQAERNTLEKTKSKRGRYLRVSGLEPFYRAESKTVGIALRAISLLNLAYCIITLAVILYSVETITWLGWTYFVAEIVIVGTLSRYEWNTATRFPPRQL